MVNTLFWVIVFSEREKINPSGITTSDCDGSARKVYIALFFQVPCLWCSPGDCWLSSHAAPSSTSLNTFTLRPKVFRITGSLGAVTQVCVWTMSDCVYLLSLVPGDPLSLLQPALSLSFLSTLLLLFPFMLGLVYSVSFCG